MVHSIFKHKVATGQRPKHPSSLDRYPCKSDLLSITSLLCLLFLFNLHWYNIHPLWLIRVSCRDCFHANLLSQHPRSRMASLVNDSVKVWSITHSCKYSISATEGSATYIRARTGAHVTTKPQDLMSMTPDCNILLKFGSRDAKPWLLGIGHVRTREPYVNDYTIKYFIS